MLDIKSVPHTQKQSRLRTARLYPSVSEHSDLCHTQRPNVDGAFPFINYIQ